MVAEIIYTRNGKEFKSRLVMEDFDDIWEGAKDIADHLVSCQYGIIEITIYKQEDKT